MVDIDLVTVRIDIRGNGIGWVLDDPVSEGACGGLVFVCVVSAGWDAAVVRSVVCIGSVTVVCDALPLSGAFGAHAVSSRAIPVKKQSVNFIFIPILPQPFYTRSFCDVCARSARVRAVGGRRFIAYCRPSVISIPIWGGKMKRAAVEICRRAA